MPLPALEMAGFANSKYHSTVSRCDPKLAGDPAIQKYEPRLLLGAWRRFESEESGNGANLTARQLCEKFFARQKAARRSAQTLADDRWRLNAFSKEVGQARAAAVKRSDILGYLEAIPPGTNRRSHYKTLRKLWRWAFDLGDVEHDPMAWLKPLDAWGVNNEVLSVELFQRFLRVTRGLEGSREGVEVSGKYKPLLPYFVLGGLQGLRTCEMVRAFVASSAKRRESGA
jgi:hypothetical protein